MESYRKRNERKERKVSNTTDQTDAKTIYIRGYAYFFK
jgi:hypothetical protein